MTAYLPDLMAAQLTQDRPDANVYKAPPTRAPAVPAYVFRTDQPWKQPSSMCDALEQWLCVCVVAAADGLSAVMALDALTASVEVAAGKLGADGITWTGTDTIYLDETAGIPLLAVAVRIQYTRNYP